MGLHSQIQNEMREALKARDETRLTVLRSLVTAFTNELVSKKRKPDEALSDEEALAVIKRAAKQRKDSIEQFETGGRADLAERERQELSVLESYLPQMMSEEEIEPLVKEKMEALGVTDKSGAGKLVGALMAELKGKADGADVKAVVDRLLAS